MEIHHTLTATLSMLLEEARMECETRHRAVPSPKDYLMLWNEDLVDRMGFPEREAWAFLLRIVTDFVSDIDALTMMTIYGLGRIERTEKNVYFHWKHREEKGNLFIEEEAAKMTDTEKITFPTSWNDRGATRTFTPPAGMIYARQIQVLLEQKGFRKGIEEVLSYNLHDDAGDIYRDAQEVVSGTLPAGLTRAARNSWFNDEYYQCLLPYALAARIAKFLEAETADMAVQEKPPVVALPLTKKIKRDLVRGVAIIESMEDELERAERESDFKYAAELLGHLRSRISGEKKKLADLLEEALAIPGFALTYDDEIDAVEEILDLNVEEDSEDPSRVEVPKEGVALPNTIAWQVRRGGKYLVAWLEDAEIFRGRGKPNAVLTIRGSKTSPRFYLKLYGGDLPLVRHGGATIPMELRKQYKRTALWEKQIPVQTYKQLSGRGDAGVAEFLDGVFG